MELQYSELNNGIRSIKLIGKLDADGFNQVDLKFTAHCAGDNIRVRETPVYFQCAGMFADFIFYINGTEHGTALFECQRRVIQRQLQPGEDLLSRFRFFGKDAIG